MDPKAKMPDIKAEVNKVDEDKKKSAGFGAFFTGGSGSGGLGGLGAGAAGGGGMLATKAGMLALILMGSAVAGGIGLAGYKMFGPGEADKTGGNLSLFTPKPQPTADPNGVAPVNADGSSASLEYMAQAAAKDKAADADASASAAAPTDVAAGDPAKDAAAADAARRAAEATAGASGAINSGGGTGATGNMGHSLANVKKLGALSGATSGGSSSASASTTKLGENLASASKNGASSGFSKGGSAGKTASNSRGLAGGRARSARGQARNVMGDQANGRAGSSFSAGRTYDGSAAPAGGAIGPEGGAIGEGVGAGTGAQPKALPANATPKPTEQEPPLAKSVKDVTPWAKQIMYGMALGAIAIALLLWASTMLKEAKLAAQAALATSPVGAPALAAALEQLQLVKIIIGAAIAAALGGIVMGTMIASGKNGQVLQGGLLIASSAAIAGIGTMMMISANDSLTPTDPKQITSDKQLAAFSTPAPWMYIIGGVAAVGLVGTMLAPKKTCKSDQDSCHAYYQRHHPSVNIV